MKLNVDIYTIHVWTEALPSWMDESLAVKRKSESRECVLSGYVLGSVNYFKA